MPTCEPTVYSPQESYVDETDLCGACSNLDFTPAVAADPGADPPVVEVPSADTLLFRRFALWASRRVFIATHGKFPGCVEITWRFPCTETACAPSCPPTDCDDRARVPLPYGPVRSITNVTIGSGEEAVVLDAGKYTVEGRDLVRLDGEQWPTDGDWTITYVHGIDIPPEAKMLIAEYTCEMIKGCQPNSNCQIRDGFRRATFNNVEYVLPDPLEYRQDQLTGYDPLDDWIVAINGGAHRARTRPRIAGQKPPGVRVR